ncbi:MAG: dihydrofolate reductase [Verrucomicrobiales bacterium]|jgi:dihydrofolate reductase
MSEKNYSLKAVVAMASNRVIGRDGQLPWHLPEDLKLFKKLTLGHPILMGRKTFDSIGRPLPKRRNIVISRTWKPEPDSGIEVIQNLEALDSLGLEGDVYLIGGAQIYAALLPECDEVWLSFVYEAHEGDTRFPEFEGDFVLAEVVEKFDAFELRRYVRP